MDCLPWLKPTAELILHHEDMLKNIPATGPWMTMRHAKDVALGMPRCAAAPARAHIHFLRGTRARHAEDRRQPSKPFSATLSTWNLFHKMVEVGGIEPPSIITTPQRLPIYPVYSVALYVRDGHSRHPPPKGPGIVRLPHPTPRFAIPAVRSAGRPAGFLDLLRSGLTP